MASNTPMTGTLTNWPAEWRLRLLSLTLIAVGGVAIAALPLTSAAVLVAGTAVVIAALVRPEISLYLLVWAVPFGSLRSVSLGSLSFTATDVLVALLGATWLMRAIAERQVRITHAPLVLPILVFLGAQLLSLFDALSYTLAAKEIIKWSEILVVYIVAASIFTQDAPAGRVRSSPRLLILAWLLLLAALAEALLGIYQFLFHAGPEWFLIGPFMRAYGTFAQPNPYAGYLNLSLPLGYALLVAGDHRSRGTKKKTLVLVLWLIVVGAAFVLSFSRGAWVGFAAAFVVITVLHSRRSAALMSAGAVLIAALLILSSANLLPSALTQRFSSITDYFRVFDVRHVEVTDANFAVVERMAHWQAGWGMFRDRPWLGWGVGNYTAAYPRYSLAGWQEALGHAHNVPLNVAAETGLVGLAAYLLFLAAALWTCWRAAQSAALRRDAVARAIALGVLGVLVAKLSHEMLDNLWVHGMGVQVAILLAMVYAAVPAQQ